MRAICFPAPGHVELVEVPEAQPGPHDVLVDVRYIGLFSTIELVANRETKEILPPAKMAELGKVLRENGLFTFLMANNMGSMVFVVSLSYMSSFLETRSFD